MMKNILYALLFAFFLTPATAQAVQYSAVISDLPLMDGMIERPELAVTFDKPDGRILKTSAETTMAPDAVLAFYKSALPALGWLVPEGAEANPYGITYQRKEEYLLITAMPVQGKTVVSFNIIPNAYIADRSEAAYKDYVKQQGQKQ